MNKFSTTKKYKKHCAKCGKKKGGSSVKGKKPAAGQKQITDGHINVLKIVDVLESDFSSESINFSCYIQNEMSEWLIDSGCSMS